LKGVYLTCFGKITPKTAQLSVFALVHRLDLPRPCIA